MTGARILGVCADDFGLGAGVCEGILELVRAGRLSAVSCLSGGPSWATFGPMLAREPAVVGGRMRVGLHFNLSEGRPLAPTLGAHWPALPRLPALIVRAHLRALPMQALADEWAAQLQAFMTVAGRAPDFVDGHQHVHHLPAIRDLVLAGVAALAATAGRPVAVRATGHLPGPGHGVKRALIALTGGRALQHRLIGSAVPHNRTLVGVYDFQAADYRRLMQRWLAGLPPSGALLFCHPGAADVGIDDPIAAARRRELDYLRSGEFLEDLLRADVSIGSAW
jgi:predicted glycoside hydrolase/deacetylase ChbG (UPF0249 family)